MQVIAREIGDFVNKSRRLLIKKAFFGDFCKPNGSAGLAHFGIFVKIIAV